MTFADLWRILEDQGVLPRPGQMKTSLRYLAAALGYDTLEACVVEEVCREEATWSTALETHFRTLTAQGLQVSAGTRRNTRNNLRVIFRQAEAHGLLAESLPPQILTKAKRVAFQETQRATNPYQSTYYVKTGPRRFGLPEAQWPADIQARQAGGITRPNAGSGAAPRRFGRTPRASRPFGATSKISARGSRSGTISFTSPRCGSFCAGIQNAWGGASARMDAAWPFSPPPSPWC
jgi:hypothetical protein